jgi:hypothetical protein
MTKYYDFLMPWHGWRQSRCASFDVFCKDEKITVKNIFLHKIWNQIVECQAEIK